MRTINLPTLYFTDLGSLITMLLHYEEQIMGKEPIFIEWETSVGRYGYYLQVKLTK